MIMAPIGSTARAGEVVWAGPGDGDWDDPNSWQVKGGEIRDIIASDNPRPKHLVLASWGLSG
ncbi:MAG: hypothetical protein HN350_07615 [Phycisphaerales bacterium]|jgi:hypothetical protein|nr:hypothetical protein [Phycisphaerales bacterium]